nr:zinc ribbon domain-containing protein [Haloglomus sp. DT116]
MNYCQNCGVELGDSANFCPECGVQLGVEDAAETERESGHRTDVSRQQPQDATERIQLDTGSATDRIYNIDNISYFQHLNHRYTLLAKAGFGVLVVLAVGVGLAIEDLVVTLIGVLFIATAWGVFRPDDGLAIGTLADKDEIDTDDPDLAEAEFLEKTSDQLSVEGTVRSSIYELEYTYHFLKRNVISIERFDSINKLRPIATLLLGSVGLAAAYLLVDSDPTIGDVNTAITISIVSNLVICVGVLYLYYGVYPLQPYLSRGELAVYFGGGFVPFVSLPMWFLTRDELNEFSSLVASSAVQEVQLFSMILLGVSVLLVVAILYLPPSGVLLSLPSEEQVQFSMTDEDVGTVIEEFRR